MNRILLAIVSLLTAFIFAGCTVHKSNIKEQLVEVPGSYPGGDALKVMAPSDVKWWEVFGDEKLNVFIEEALRNNLEIAGASEKLRQLEAAVRVTDSARGFIVSIDGAGGRKRTPAITGTTEDSIFSLSAAASYEIDLWNKLRSSTGAARLDALASEEDLKALYISISAQAADLYYLSLEQKAQLELTEQTIDSYRDTLDKVERRYRSGLVPSLDVYQSRQNLMSAEAQQPLFRSTLMTTLNSLDVLSGRFPGTDQNEIDGEIPDVPEFGVGIPSELLVRRPDIRAALTRLRASDERVAAAIADRFPSFNLVGSYGGSSNRLRTMLDSPNIAWSVLLQLAQPVLDAGRRKAEVERSEAVFRENLIAYHKTLLNAFKEVQDALENNSAAEKRIEILKKNVSASDSSLRLALDRYMSGLTDYLPVLSEQLRNFTARSGLIKARRQLISDRIQLARALGGNWMDEFIKEKRKSEKQGH